MKWLRALLSKESENLNPSERLTDYQRMEDALVQFEVEKISDRRLVYLSNGAKTDAGRYTEIFGKYGLEGKELDSGNGSGIYAAIQILSRMPEKQIAVNGFMHEDAVFMGFYARKKVGGKWYWLTEGNKWSVIDAVMPAKYLIKDEEHISQLWEEPDEIIFLVAQWRERDSNRFLNCGYQMFTNRLMAHAFGGYRGETYCNTKAAFKNGIKNGYQYYEVDFSYTNDGRLVLCHGWTKSNCKHTGFTYSPSFENMTYRRIMRKKVHGERIMDVREFYREAVQLPYVYEVDFHNIRGDDAKKRICSLLEDFRYDEKMLHRILIQVYSEEMFFAIDSVYHFSHYQYLVGKNMDKLDEIITFCLDHGICAVAIRANLAKPFYVRKLKNAGLYILCYTVQSDIDYAGKLLDSGVDTICTDWITPEQLTQSKNNFGKYPFYVYYNSGTSPDGEQYSQLIEQGILSGKVEKLESGNVEYKDQNIWQNDGARGLTPNYFAVEGKTFAGWKLRISIEGKQFWYCNDHCYHAGADLKNTSGLDPVIFADGSVLPIWTFKRNTKLIMVAVWK